MDIDIATSAVTPVDIANALLNAGSITMRDETYSITIGTTGGFTEYRVTTSNGDDVNTNSVVPALSLAADFIYAVNGEPEAPNWAAWTEISNMLAELGDV